MNITRLEVENIKRVNAVTITPDGAIVEITGRNGQGKSSVLDSIAYGLGGKDEIPSQPIRKGAAKAQIVIELDDKIVTRRWSKGGNTTLTVESKDGAKFSSPQALLDSLTGDLTFDPLAFRRMSPREQVATLKNVAGLDFADLDRQRQEAYDERTIVNRTLKDANGTLANTPEVEAPAEAVGMAGLIIEQNEATQQQHENDKVRTNHEAWKTESDRLIGLRNEAAATLKALDAKIEDAHANCAKIVEQIDQLQTPDLDAIAVKIAGAEEANEKFRAAARRADLVTQRDDHKSTADKLTEQIDRIDEKKIQTVRDANLPVDGLGFDEHGISLNGLPFDQASSAEQLRVSVAMGVALNPKLRVMLIRDGSLLDKDSLAVLAEMAEKSKTQVWLERVSDGEDVGIVIEDGYVRGAEITEAAAMA